MNHKFRPWIIGLGVTAALLGGACGSDATATRGAADSSSNSAGKEPSATQSGSSDERKEAVDPASQQVKMEEEVAKCMKTKGWEYTPMPPIELDNDQSNGGFGVVDEKYGKEHGYGIVDAFSGAAPSAGGGGGSMIITGTAGGAAPAGGAGQSKDPNGEYVESLSEGERAQYYADLFGKQASEGLATTEAGGGAISVGSGAEGGALEMGGCQGEAAKAVGFGFGGPDGQVLDPMADLENDPAIIESTEKWASCMSEKGFDAESPMKVVQEFVENTVLPAMSPAGGEGEPGDPPASGGQAPDQSVIDSLLAQEIELWTADNACQKSSGYEKAQKQVFDRLGKAGK